MSSIISEVKPPVRRRNRSTMVCNRCRRRKIRCDKNKPCLNCVKANFPCSYGSDWAPKPKEDVLPPKVAKKLPPKVAKNLPPKVAKNLPPKVAKNLPPEVAKKLPQTHTAAGLNVSLSTDTVKSSSPSLHDLKYSNNPWSASLVQDMVLIRKEAFEKLLPQLLQVPRNVEVAIAPIMLGATGHTALNSNVGVARCGMHNPKFPGLLPDDDMKLSLIELEPHVVRLVKNDFTGVNPFQDKEDHLDFAAPLVPSDPRSGRIWDHHGVFTWRTLQLKDMWLSCIMKYTGNDSDIEGEMGEGEMRKDGIGKTHMRETQNLGNMDMMGNNDRTGNTMAIKDMLTDNMADSMTDTDADTVTDTTRDTMAHNEPLNASVPPPINHNVTKTTNTSTLGLILYDGHVRLDLQMVEQMRRMLPNRRVVWTLLRRFFLVLYPFCPVFDEFDFRSAIAKIIGPETYDEKPVVVRVSSSMDMIHLATLLAMIRFSYVSLFSNKKGATEQILASTDPVDQELKYLFTHPVDVNSIDLCQSCLHHLALPRAVLVPLFLLAMILRTYFAHAPEEYSGVDGKDCHHYSSFVVSMAYHLGFHRDPGNYPGKVDPRKVMLIRKAWIFLCVCDVFQGYRYGNPMFANVNYFDTKFPSFHEKSANLIDKELDHAVIKILSFSDLLIDGAMREIVELSLNARLPAYLSYLTSLLNMLETCEEAGFGHLTDYLRPLEMYNAAYCYGKVMKCSILLSLQLFFFTVLMHVLHYYEGKGNVALYFYYLKKLFHIAINSLLAVAPTFVTKIDELFGDGVSFFMNPTIIDAILRVTEFFISSTLRCNNYLYSRKKSPDHDLRMASDPDYYTHFLKVCELVVLHQKICRLCVVLESILSNRYFFAWRIFKRHQSFLLLMADPRFYDWANIDPMLSSTEGHQKFTCAQLQELIDILKKGLAFIEKQVAENSEDITVESVWGKPQRTEVPVIIKSKLPDYVEKLSVTPIPSPAPAALASLSTLGMSPGVEIEPNDMSKMFDLDLFALDDLKSFNDYEVDSLWQQMSSQKIQKSEQMDRAAWHGPLGGF